MSAKSASLEADAFLKSPQISTKRQLTEKTSIHIQREETSVAKTYKPIPVVLSRGEGVFVFDIEGNSYIDMTSAYSAVSHGHCHPELVEAMYAQAKQLTIPSRAFYSEPLAAFMDVLCDLSGLPVGIPMNTGAEAVETAIKCARRWGYEKKKIPKSKAEIIVANENFHGRTTSIIGFSSEPEYKRNFGPFSPGYVHIPFGDSQSLEQAITPNTCAFLVEPMQGEGGIHIPPSGWLKDVKKICAKNNVLLILDEIQTGLCRTGAWFAHHHEDVKPDGLILGKALGGGLLPVSAFPSTTDVMDLMTPGSHGSTFGGNPLGAVVAQKALEIMQRENYAKKSKEQGDYLLEQLKAIKSPFIIDVRGKGLWIGVELNPELIEAREVCERLVHYGVLCKETHETVVRFAPPLVITREQLDFVLSAFQQVLLDYEQNVKRDR